MVDFTVVLSSGFGPLSLFKYEKKSSQYTLKLCHIINNISMKTANNIPTTIIQMKRNNEHIKASKESINELDI